MEKLKNLNLLYVEDELTTKNNYEKTFNLIFNFVYSAVNYDDAMFIYENYPIDLILIDIELNSDKNGFDIASKIRKTNINLPIVFLTGHDDTDLVLEAINSNINGYLVKPLCIESFFKVINNTLLKVESKNTLQFNNFIYNFSTFELFNLSGDKINLGRKQHKLLQVLLRNKYRILRREELEYEIWNEPLDSDTTLKNLIASLRKKIGKEMIINESKIGWRIRFD